MHDQTAPAGLLAQMGHPNSALIAFAVYISAVFVLAWASNRLRQSKSFLSEYFLGSRSLGMWAFALTFAATSASGGSFIGFPSLVYSHGWIVALWIGSYMIVPIVSMGLLAKRLNQLARKTGAITIPDVLRDRFESIGLGSLATCLIVFFMAFNLVAQFIGGSVMLNTLLEDVPAFNAAKDYVATGVKPIPYFSTAANDPGYLICLLVFAVAVIVYTTYGGFRAVVWTDVMQGFVMVAGVAILLPLTLWAVGGLGRATEKMSEMTPPQFVQLYVTTDRPVAEGLTIENNRWLVDDRAGQLRVFRTTQRSAIPPGGQRAIRPMEEADGQQALVSAIELTTEQQKHRIAEADLALPLHPVVVRQGRLQLTLPDDQVASHELHLPAGTVVQVHSEADASTFWRTQARAVFRPGHNTAQRLKWAGEPDFAIPAYHVQPRWEAVDGSTALPVELNATLLDTFEARTYASGDQRPGVYVTGPGPSATAASGFLPLSLAISFFFMWTFSGAGQPSNMVRLMAFRNALTLRRAIFTVSIYYSLIYFPLVIIFCCARVLLPGWESESDRIMPEMAKHVTAAFGMAWLGGLLVAAPFAAVMSTMDSFLLMISSALVRDVYQRHMHPQASERTIRRLTYLVTILIGTFAMVLALSPPQFLQDIIVFTGSGLSSSFLVPVALALYWPRFNKAGALAGMLGGFCTLVTLYGAGYLLEGRMAAVQPLNFHPFLVGVATSLTCAIIATLSTAPPPEKLVRRFFHAGEGERG